MKHLAKRPEQARWFHLNPAKWQSPCRANSKYCTKSVACRFIVNQSGVVVTKFSQSADRSPGHVTLLVLRKWLTLVSGNSIYSFKAYSITNRLHVDHNLGLVELQIKSCDKITNSTTPPRLALPRLQLEPRATVLEKGGRYLVTGSTNQLSAHALTLRQ